MIPESMWPGMFQAEAESSNTVSVKRTRAAISDTVASYAISDEQRGKEKFWTTANESQ